MNNNPTAAGATVQPPRQTERKGGVTTLYTRVYPRIYGGVCEKCGVMDNNQPSTNQYRLCEHYRGLGVPIECSYCEPTRDVKEMTRISQLYVYDHPTKRDELNRPVLSAVCDSFTCQNQFNNEWGK